MDTHIISQLRGHIGVKSYQCCNCDKAFSTNGILKIHLRRHSGEKPFKCRQCDKSFTENFDLIKHIRTHWRETI